MGSIIMKYETITKHPRLGAEIMVNCDLSYITQAQISQLKKFHAHLNEPLLLGAIARWGATVFEQITLTDRPDA
jgi:hypothetical protein